MNNAALRKLRSILKPQEISNLAHSIKFNQRSTSQINGFRFIQMLITQVGSGHELSYRNLNDTLSNCNPDINISTQALSKYFYKEVSVKLIKAVYQEVFQCQKDHFFTKCSRGTDSEILDHFKCIFIHDSTVCTINKALENEYKGAGGSASSASVKIDVIHELKTSTIVELNLTQGKKADVGFAHLDLEIAKEGDLVLRDLGYFKIEIFGKLDKNGVYFISRYKHDVSVYLNETGKPIDLGEHLQKLSRKWPSGIIEFEVYLGAVKQKVRLVAYRVSEEESNKRRGKVKRLGQKQGWTPSQERLKLCDYVILVTNISSKMVSAEVIGTIYRLRWTIELIFKAWKSNLNLQLNLTKGSKVRRIECFIYATLLVCLLTTFVHSKLMSEVAFSGKEISLEKLMKCMLNRDGYRRLAWGSATKLQEEIKKNMREITKQKRTRKTTLERVESLETYSEKYALNF